MRARKVVFRPLRSPSQFQELCAYLRTWPAGFPPAGTCGSGSTGDEEHHVIHRATAQAQGEREEERGGAPADAEVSWIQFYRGYFGFCETPDLLIQLTRWFRLRLRSALWRQWKTQRCRRAMLLQLGVR